MDIAVGAADKAFLMAQTGHKGQKRWGGDPYIIHPISVASHFSDDVTKAVAYLHDILEDTEVSEQQLRAQFSDEIVDAVVALTRREEDETYMDYVRRAVKNPIARRVKLADLYDNLQSLPSDSRQRIKYREAYDYILSTI